MCFGDITADVLLPLQKFVLCSLKSVTDLLWTFVVPRYPGVGLNPSQWNSKGMFKNVQSHIRLLWIYLTQQSISKQDLTIWVPAHLIGQPSKAPFIPELLWQAGTFKNPPLQPFESRHDLFNLLTGSKASHLVRLTQELTNTIFSEALRWFISQPRLNCLLERETWSTSHKNIAHRLLYSVFREQGRKEKAPERATWRTDSLLCLSILPRDTHNEQHWPTANGNQPPLPHVQLSTFCTQSAQCGQSRCHQSISEVTGWSQRIVIQLEKTTRNRRCM